MTFLLELLQALQLGVWSGFKSQKCFGIPLVIFLFLHGFAKIYRYFLAWIFLISFFLSYSYCLKSQKKLKGQHSVRGTKASGSHQIVYSGACVAGWVWLWVKTRF